tara:strand:- start:114 stop:494 length:381 start_codon:yes stop_codon:yes gene_type:complete
MKMKFKFNLRNKEILMEVERCESFWSKTRGLMFRNKLRPLLFVLRSPRRFSIHSFFCKPFIAIWLLKGEIVDVKIVKPWTLRVLPKKQADALLEIPFNNEEQIKQFLVGSQKDLNTITNFFRKEVC